MLRPATTCRLWITPTPSAQPPRPGICPGYLKQVLRDWYRFKLGGKPLPGVPAGPAHFVGLVLTQDRKAVANIIPHFYIIGDDGRIAAYVDVAPEVKPRYYELLTARQPTLADEAELDRIREETWGVHDPEPSMIRALLRDLPWPIDPSDRNGAQHTLRKAGLSPELWAAFPTVEKH